MSKKGEIENESISDESVSFLTDPSKYFLLTISMMHQKNIPDVNLAAIAESYVKQLKALQSGDTKDIEAMLYTQAITLNALFHDLTRITTTIIHKPEARFYVELAYKAQKQCRQTLTALANIKDPHKTTFVKQQNMAINQQVNNGANSEILEKNSRNELLKEDYNKTQHLKVDVNVIRKVVLHNEKK